MQKLVLGKGGYYCLCYYKAVPEAAHSSELLSCDVRATEGCGRPLNCEDALERSCA